MSDKSAASAAASSSSASAAAAVVVVATAGGGAVPPANDTKVAAVAAAATAAVPVTGPNAEAKQTAAAASGLPPAAASSAAAAGAGVAAEAAPIDFTAALRSESPAACVRDAYVALRMALEAYDSKTPGNAQSALVPVPRDLLTHALAKLRRADRVLGQRRSGSGAHTPDATEPRGSALSTPNQPTRPKLPDTDGSLFSIGAAPPDDKESEYEWTLKDVRKAGVTMVELPLRRGRDRDRDRDAQPIMPFPADGSVAVPALAHLSSTQRELVKHMYLAMYGHARRDDGRGGRVPDEHMNLALLSGAQQKAALQTLTARANYPLAFGACFTHDDWFAYYAAMRRVHGELAVTRALLGPLFSLLTTDFVWDANVCFAGDERLFPDAMYGKQLGEYDRAWVNGANFPLILQEDKTKINRKGKRGTESDRYKLACAAPAAGQWQVDAMRRAVKPSDVDDKVNARVPCVWCLRTDDTRVHIALFLCDTQRKPLFIEFGWTDTVDTAGLASTIRALTAVRQLSNEVFTKLVDSDQLSLGTQRAALESHKPGGGGGPGGPGGGGPGGAGGAGGPDTKSGGDAGGQGSGAGGAAGPSGGGGAAAAGADAGRGTSSSKRSDGGGGSQRGGGAGHRYSSRATTGTIAATTAVAVDAHDGGGDDGESAATGDAGAAAPDENAQPLTPNATHTPYGNTTAANDKRTGASATTAAPKPRELTEFVRGSAYRFRQRVTERGANASVLSSQLTAYAKSLAAAAAAAAAADPDRAPLQPVHRHTTANANANANADTRNALAVLTA